MTKETTYYADDGEEFYTEEACLAYEAECKKLLETVLFFDKGMKRLESPQEIEEKSWYAFIRDGNKAENLFRWLYNYVGVEMPECELTTGDILATDEKECEWYNVTQRVAVDTQTMEAVGIALSFIGREAGAT